MTAEFSISLAVLSVLIVLARFLLPQLPIAGAARQLSKADVAMLTIGALGLTFHCAAMFYRPLFDGLTFLAPLVSMVNALGVGSIILYTVPAVLVFVGLRRQHPLSLAAAGIALFAVGVTMYVRGLGSWHLTAIFVTVLLLAGIVAFLTTTPWTRSAKGATAAA